MESNSKIKKLRLLNEWLLANNFAKEAGELNSLIPKPSYLPPFIKLSYNRKSIETFGEEESKKLQETFKRWWRLWASDNNALREEIQALSPREAERTYLRFFIINEYNNPDLKELLNMRTLDQTVTIDKTKFTHNVLDIAGMVAAPADIINGFLYIAEKPPDWFGATFSLFAAIPFIGIGVIGIKRAIKTAIETGEKAKLPPAMEKLFSSPEEIIKATDEKVEELLRVAQKLEDYLPEEIMRNLPDDAKIREEIMKQVNRIINSIEFSSTRTDDLLDIGRRRYREPSEAVLDKIDDAKAFYKTLSPERIAALSRLAHSAAKTGIAKVSEYLGPIIRKKIIDLDPNLPPDIINKIANDFLNKIKKVETILVDNPDDLRLLESRSASDFDLAGGMARRPSLPEVDRYVMDLVEEEGLTPSNWSMSLAKAISFVSIHTGVGSAGKMYINMPSLAPLVFRGDLNLHATELADSIVQTIIHEFYHIVDGHLSTSYYRAYPEMFKKGIKYYDEAGNVILPNTREASLYFGYYVSSLRGSRLGSSIHNLISSIDSGVEASYEAGQKISNHMEYLRKPTEIGARFKTVKTILADPNYINRMIELTTDPGPNLDFRQPFVEFVKKNGADHPDAPIYLFYIMLRNSISGFNEIGYTVAEHFTVIPHAPQGLKQLIKLIRPIFVRNTRDEAGNLIYDSRAYWSQHTGLETFREFKENGWKKIIKPIYDLV
tara:strand:+ start:71 stop:2227 length:2157 start_codon:yes stop_codon:yes gene_type:complete